MGSLVANIHASARCADSTHVKLRRLPIRMFIVLAGSVLATGRGDAIVECELAVKILESGVCRQEKWNVVHDLFLLGVLFRGLYTTVALPGPKRRREGGRHHNKIQ